MQQPTIPGVHIKTTQDALIVFHAVRHGMLPMVRRRLDAEERRNIMSGDVFVWEERGPNAEASGLGIERWTDSIRWGPSRTKDDFLFYHERQPHDALADATDSSDTPYRRRPLIKQTYSVYLEHTGRRAKWHLIAYYTQNTLHHLRTVTDFPELANIPVPDGAYKSARNPKRPAREVNATERSMLQPYQYQIRGATPHEEAGNMQDNGHHEVARLAPLQYLQSIAPPRRHAVDEMALIRLPITINSDHFSPSYAVHRHLISVPY